MLFSPPLQSATLIKRYKRFLADVTLANGEITTIHCANTGAMTGCAEPNSVIWYSTSASLKRKLPYSWELTYTNKGHWICINTIRANTIVKEAIMAKKIDTFNHYSHVLSEVKYGDENSRIDILLRDEQNNECYIEVKSVTLYDPINQYGYFPDAVTVRGQKHLRELSLMVKQGKRAIIFFLIQHSGIEYFSPAQSIDPAYCEALREAILNGVEVLCYNTTISTTAITLDKQIPFVQLNNETVI